MIPQRIRSDFAGSEIRERVKTCRKRLRVKRFMQKAAVGSDFDEDCAASVSFLDDESAMRESLSGNDLSSAALDRSNDAQEMLLTMRKREVGVT